MSRKWIVSLVLILVLEMVPVGSVEAALDEGNFIPCYSILLALTGAHPLYHCIEQGDTLWDICQNYSVDLENVKALNNLDNQSILTVGQKLRIPNGEARVHIVKKGETLRDVAGLYNISLDQLCQANQGVNPQNLNIGMSLVLPQGAQGAGLDRLTPSRSSLGNAIFNWPIVGAITSAFGWRSSGFHHGMDIAAHYGESVRAAASGVISYAGSKNVYGKNVMIKHLDGSETMYAHLSQIFVTEGQQVSRGEIVGAVGTTGNSTGPHLHFELRKNKKAVNPSSVLR